LYTYFPYRFWKLRTSTLNYRNTPSVLQFLSVEMVLLPKRLCHNKKITQTVDSKTWCLGSLYIKTMADKSHQPPLTKVRKISTYPQGNETNNGTHFQIKDKAFVATLQFVNAMNKMCMAKSILWFHVQDNYLYKSESCIT
jgi:hypothetical protein